MASKIYDSFNNYLHDYEDYVKTSQKRLEISDQSVKKIEELREDWDSVYKLYIDKSTKTSVVVAHIATAYINAKKYLISISQFVDKNPSVTKTDTDYIKLNIHKRKKESPVPKPTVAMQVDVRETNNLTVTFEFTDPNPGVINHLAKPEGIARFKIQIGWLAAGQSEKDVVFEDYPESNTTIHKIVFPEEYRGRTGFIKIYPVNHKGEIGPVSVVTKFYVI